MEIKLLRATVHNKTMKYQNETQSSLVSIICLFIPFPSKKCRWHFEQKHQPEGPKRIQLD